MKLNIASKHCSLNISEKNMNIHFEVIVIILTGFIM